MVKLTAERLTERELRETFDAARLLTPDDERCRWPECTCYGPQAPNHCRRQTKRTLGRAALSNGEEQQS